MAETKKRGWGLFWALFALGWGLFASIAATNGRLSTPASPGGILDHQVAATAVRVDEIQGAWASAGMLDFARLSIAIDLAFIGVLSIAGVLGGLCIAGAAKGPLVRGLGWLTATAFLMFGATDYAETIAQFVQAMSQGNDQLAQLAAIANKPKIASFIGGHLTLIAGLVGIALTRGRPAQPAV